MSKTPNVAARSIDAFTLPASVISKVDLSRLVGELEQVNETMITATVRTKAGSPRDQPPELSTALTDFLQQNDLTLDNPQARTGLIKQLRQLKDTVPVIHLTFAVQADRESLGQMAQWLRTSVHPQAVIAVGLQPGLIAGVYARTANQVHDMSLRGLLADGRKLLVKELEALHGEG